MEAIERVRRGNLSIAVYPNRVEVKKRGLFFFFPTVTTILMRNITSVDVKRGTQTLVIHTNDGKAFQWRVGMGLGADKLRDAILDQI